ncbi:MAG: cupin domain-containing protein [Alphaproteobacteria bacterium]|nr:cupin domain-containing protein [Alphaproteobacteria bacterium]
MIERLKPDFEFSDERGCLVQLAHAGWEQINFLLTKAGVHRGGHYHKETREAFYVIDGELELTAKRDGQTEHHSFTTGDFFVIQPLISHSMTFAKDTRMIALYDKCVERADGTKDIFTGEWT